MQYSPKKSEDGMRFKEIEIFGFGKLKNNIRIPFARRVNVILAPNDKGKSTLLEAMFEIGRAHV